MDLKESNIERIEPRELSILGMSEGEGHMFCAT